MKQVEKKIREELLGLKDKNNQIFVARLIPNIDSECILGIKTPLLRKIANTLVKDEKNFEFLNCLPHKYLEENTLHGFFIEKIKDLSKAFEEVEKFLPYIDNWATCDSFSPSVFKKYPNEVYEKIKTWIKSDKTYTIRYAIKLLLENYLDGNFKEEMLEMVADIHSDEYYVQMMQAWYFATALAKQEKPTLSIIKRKSLDCFVQNKSIQKARESRRITNELKEALKQYKL